VEWASVATKWTSPCSTSELANSGSASRMCRQASRGHLQQAAPLDQGAQNAGLVEQTAIAFGVGQYTNQPGAVQFVEQPLQGT